MRSADIIKVREFWEGVFGRQPVEIAPRLLLIGQFPAGRPGLHVPPPGAGLSLDELLQEYGDGSVNAELDYARVFARQSDGGVAPAGFNVANVVPATATRAVSGTVTNQVPVTPVAQFRFEAIGPGATYNNLVISITCTRIVNDHPLGNNIPVCRVTVESVNPRYAPEVFENVVFTYTNATNGSSAYHRTVEAQEVIEDSRIVRLVYDVAANGSLTMTVGQTITATLAGGTEGGAVTDTDWTGLIAQAEDLPFVWRVAPALPSGVVRDYLHNSNKAAPFGVATYLQRYGETLAAFTTARNAAGNEADDGKSMTFFGHGQHPAAGGREVSFSAAYLGRFSAKINALGLGGAYAVSNQPLGYTSIAPGDRLTRTQREQAAAAGINVATRLLTGQYGVMGYYTMDDQVDRMGDISIRVIMNDVIRRLFTAFMELPQNRANNPGVQDKIRRLGDQVIQPYQNLGYVRRAATGTFSLEEARTRLPGLSFPTLPGWAAYVASLQFFPTLGGIYIMLTDKEVAGLTAVAGGQPQASATSEGEGAR